MNGPMQIQPGDKVLVGKRLITLTPEFVETLREGDVIVGIEQTGSVRRISKETSAMAHEAVSASLRAFSALSSSNDQQVSLFFDEAASLLSSDDVFGKIEFSNKQDVDDARARGRSVTRLHLSEKMRSDMVSAFEMWRDSVSRPFSQIESIQHDGWTIEQWKAPLGVVGFVFEGRPNVFADATGVLRTGNTVVFRIGSDALRTAQTIMELVIRPALRRAGLPQDAVILLNSKEHAAGWALFSDSRLSLAVARGSGEAVSELGSIARQSGVPASLHGTGGAWMIVGSQANSERLFQAVLNSLDRKVCNTVNVIVVLRSRQESDLQTIVRAATQASEARGTSPRIHCVDDLIDHFPSPQKIQVVRAHGIVEEPQFTQCRQEDLGKEFEWEETPEFFIVAVDSLEEGVHLFNQYSPQFVISVISDSPSEKEEVWLSCNAPFFGDGFTRWVDGQFAFNRPELGLSNWQFGRLFARGGVLSGDSVFTVRARVHQADPTVHR